MPQIEQLAATYGSQIFWLLVTFGLVYLIIGRGMARKVVDTVDLRDRTVADDLATADAARAAVDEVRARAAAAAAAAAEQLIRERLGDAQDRKLVDEAIQGLGRAH